MIHVWVFALHVHLDALHALLLPLVVAALMDII